MKIAIIGAGFSGLATAWHLKNHFFAEKIQQLVVFDQKKLGEGTSGNAAGLIHPFAGGQAKFNRAGAEGMAATLELIEVAEKNLGSSVKGSLGGILRLAVSEKQQLDFYKTAEQYPLQTSWLLKEKVEEMVPQVIPAPALWVRQGFSVYSALYLKGLWKALEKQGVVYEQKKVQSIEEVKDFDFVILAAGAETLAFRECSPLSISRTKGQILELSWPKDLPPLNYSLNSHIYVLMSPSQDSCLVGATYEKKYADDSIDVETAKAELLPKAYLLFPPLKDSVLLNSYVGVRAGTPDRLPFFKQLTPKLWILSGMGSKGLLYHALFAKKLVETILRNA